MFRTEEDTKGVSFTPLVTRRATENQVRQRKKNVLGDGVGMLLLLVNVRQNIMHGRKAKRLA